MLYNFGTYQYQPDQKVLKEMCEVLRKDKIYGWGITAFLGELTVIEPANELAGLFSNPRLWRLRKQQTGRETDNRYDVRMQIPEEIQEAWSDGNEICSPSKSQKTKTQ